MTCIQSFAGHAGHVMWVFCGFWIVSAACLEITWHHGHGDECSFGLGSYKHRKSSVTARLQHFSDPKRCFDSPQPCYPGLHGTVDGDMRTRSSVTNMEVRGVSWRQIHEIKVLSVGSNCKEMRGMEKRHAAHLFCQAALTVRPHDRQPARFGMKRTCSNAAIRDLPAKTEHNMLPSRELRTSLWNEQNIASCFKFKSWPSCAKLQLLVSILHTNHIPLLWLSWKFRPIIFQQGFDLFKLPTHWNAQTVIESFKLMILRIQASPVSLSLFGFQVS